MRWFLPPWITGSLTPKPSMRLRITSIARASASLRMVLIWFCTSTSVSSGLPALTLALSRSSSIATVKLVPPERSRPRRIFSLGGTTTYADNTARKARTSHFQRSFLLI